MGTDDRRDDMENSTTEVNPWPYIKDKEKKKGKSIIMQCKMCLPKEVK